MLKYKNFQLIKPDDVISEQINNLILKRDGSIFHETVLNQIIEKSFNSDFYYLVDNPDNIKNAAGVHITKNKLHLRRYNIKPLYDIPYAGFIGNDVIDFSLLNISCLESLNYAGFPYTKKKDEININHFGETAIVDLNQSLQDIFNKSINYRRRRKIREAIKAGYTIKSYFTTEGLFILWPILKELHKKLKYKKMSYDYYKEIFQYYSVKKQAFIIIAFKNHTPVSGIFIIGNVNYMHFFKGASLRNFQNEGQGELLQWEAIKISKNLGSHKYDLCNLNQRQLPELFQFKTGFSKNIFQYQKYTYNPICYKILNKISRLF